MNCCSTVLSLFFSLGVFEDVVVVGRAMADSSSRINPSKLVSAKKHLGVNEGIALPLPDDEEDVDCNSNGSILE